MIKINIHQNSFRVFNKSYELTGPTYDDRVSQARCTLILYHGLCKYDFDKIKFIDCTVEDNKKKNIAQLEPTKRNRIHRYDVVKDKLPPLDKKYYYISFHHNRYTVCTQLCPFANKNETIRFTNLQEAIEHRDSLFSSNLEFLEALKNAENGDKKQYWKFVRSNSNRSNTGEQYITNKHNGYVVRIDNKQKTFKTLEDAIKYRDSQIINNTNKGE